MKSLIFEVRNDNGKVNQLATYSVDAKKAMVAFVKQQENDYNIVNYPDIIKGMRKSPIKKSGWLYDDLKNNRVLVSYEE